MEGAVLGFGGKMGFGVLRYSPNPIVCVIDSETAGRDSKKLPGMSRSCPIVASIEEAAAMGAEAVVLGIAPPGGRIPKEWLPVIDRAASNSGLSLIQQPPLTCSLRATATCGDPVGQWVYRMFASSLPSLQPGNRERRRPYRTEGC